MAGEWCSQYKRRSASLTALAIIFPLPVMRGSCSFRSFPKLYMEVKIEPSWKEHLASEFEQSYFADLTTFVKRAYQEGKVYPPPKHIFRAFDLCPFEKVKVVILGQDPYHGARQANGLAFAVEATEAAPPSLQNIFKEIESDCGHLVSTKSNGDLTQWAEQGVLLLNATLTVRAHLAG